MQRTVWQHVVLTLGLLALGASGAIGADEGTGERLPAIDAGDFERLHSTIKPQPGESPWREIDWLTDITEARRRSIAENKPIVIFTAADGSPLART